MFLQVTLYSERGISSFDKVPVFAADLERFPYSPSILSERGENGINKTSLVKGKFNSIAHKNKSTA